MGDLYILMEAEIIYSNCKSDFDLGTSDFTIEGGCITSYGNGQTFLGQIQLFLQVLLQINVIWQTAILFIKLSKSYIKLLLQLIFHQCLDSLGSGTKWKCYTIYLNGKSDTTVTNAALNAGFDSTNPLHIMRWNNIMVLWQEI